MGFRRWVLVATIVMAVFTAFPALLWYLRRPVTPTTPATTEAWTVEVVQRTKTLGRCRGMPVVIFGEGLYQRERWLLEGQVEDGPINSWSPSLAQGIAACSTLFDATTCPFPPGEDLDPRIVQYWKNLFFFFRHYVENGVYGVQVFGFSRGKTRWLYLNIGREALFDHSRWTAADFMNRMEDGGLSHVQVVINADTLELHSWRCNSYVGEDAIEWEERSLGVTLPR